MTPFDAAPMFPPRPTALAHQLLRGMLLEGDLVIDATAGNGHDTLFLADCVGPSGRVIAFDVQEAAITAARHRIESAGFAERVKFQQQSHAHLGEHAEAGSVAAVMFNLGYLPGNDHGLTTESAVTLAALEQAARVLGPGGGLTLICYPGHPAGALEARAVEAALESMTAEGWRVVRYGAIGNREAAPFLLAARKPGAGLHS